MEQEIRVILKEQYAQTVDEDMPVRYYLDFKANVRLEQLREALQRIEESTYGTCLACKAEIPQYILEESPCALFCGSCTAIMLHQKKPDAWRNFLGSFDR